MALLMGFSSYTCSIRSPLKSHCIPGSIPFLAFSSATAYVIHSKMVLNACSVAIVMDTGFWQYKDNAGLCEHDHAKELMSTSVSCFQSFSVVSAPRSRESAVMLFHSFLQHSAAFTLLLGFHLVLHRNKSVISTEMKEYMLPSLYFSSSLWLLLFQVGFLPGEEW